MESMAEKMPMGNVACDERRTGMKFFYLFALMMPIFQFACFERCDSPLLMAVAKEVSEEELASGETQALIDEMLAIARGERLEMEKRIMVGLATPQIGMSKRIILVDIGIDDQRKDLGTLVAYINPEILSVSEEKEAGREGCYSVDKRVCGIVSRPAKIKIRALDREGKVVCQELMGFTARIFQHELDHLNGVRFPDRVGREGMLHWVEEEEYPLYRKEWQEWQRRCPWETWLAMKEGRLYSNPNNGNEENEE
jgi:peptide deformylase